MKIRGLIVVSFALMGMAFASFDACKFNFGKGWSNSADLTGMDFVSIYAGDAGAWNAGWHGSMVTAAKNAGVTPVLYGYLTAFMARQNAGLKDCDVGTPNLCTGGSDYIRNHKADILALYTTYAQNIANIIGANGDVIFLVEPDLYQYSVSGSNQRGSYNSQYQTNGGIADADVAAYFKSIVTTIRTYLPKAKIGVDISPWISNPTAWYGNFDKSIIDFAFTSGGRSQAGLSTITTGDAMKWSDIKSLLGKPVMADCGYAVGGASTGHDPTWDNLANIKSRIADGVISINQFNAESNWNSAVLTALRLQVPSIGTCQVSSSSTASSSSKTSSSSVAISSSSKVSSSSIVVSSSSIAPSSSSVTVSSSGTSTCIAFVNGVGNYDKNCYNSGLTNMASNTCYTMNPAQSPAPAYINFDASQTYWWVVTPCSQASSSSSVPSSSSVAVSSSSVKVSSSSVASSSSIAVSSSSVAPSSSSVTVSSSSILVSSSSSVPSSSSVSVSSSSVKVSSSSVASSSSIAVSSSSILVSSSSSSSVPSSSSVSVSSSSVKVSSSSAAFCIAFVNGTGGYDQNCYNSGLLNMVANTCYTMNPAQLPAPTYINSDVNQTYWWVVASCDGTPLSSSSIATSSSSNASSSVPSSSSVMVALSSSDVGSSSSVLSSSASSSSEQSSSNASSSTSSSSNVTGTLWNAVTANAVGVVVQRRDGSQVRVASVVGAQMWVVDIHGRVIMDFRVGSSERFLDLSGLQSGIYLLHSTVRSQVQSIRIPNL